MWLEGCPNPYELQQRLGEWFSENHSKSFYQAGSRITNGVTQPVWPNVAEQCRLPDNFEPGKWKKSFDVHFIFMWVKTFRKVSLNFVYNPITHKKRAGFNRAHMCMIPFLKMIYSRLLERTEYKIVPKVRQIVLLPIQKVQLLLRLFDYCSMSNRLCTLLVYLLNVPIHGTN